MGCNDIATYLTGGEGQGSAVEGEGSPSDEQTEDPTGQSRCDGGVEVGLEIDGGGVDAAVTIDRGEDGGVALVGGQGRVLDEEELSADFQGIVGSLAAVHPDGSTVGDLLRGGQAVISHREANPFDHVPQGCIVGGVEDDLIAGDSGARGAGYRIYRLPAVEEGELVAFDERGVVVDDRLRKLRHGGCRAYGEGTEAGVGSMHYAFAADGTATLTATGMDGATTTYSGTWTLSDDGVLSSDLLPDMESWNVNWITPSTMILSCSGLGTDEGDFLYQIQFEAVTNAGQK